MLRRALERLGLIRPVYRFLEWRLTRSATDWPDTADGLPVPPPYLVALVAGHANFPHFIEQGVHLSGFLEQTLARHGSGFSSGGTVLDFGCGCGRVARHVAPKVLAGGGRFVGVDVNRRLIDWCRKRLPGDYHLNRLLPPTSLAGDSVDVMYAVSVFTHLSPDRMRAWLAEYARLLKPGGIALVSFADQDRASPELRPRLERDGFAASTLALEGSNYMASYATTDAFARMAAEHLAVREILPSASTGETLAWAVLQKPETSEPRPGR